MDDRFSLRQVIRLFGILALGTLITLYAPTFEFVSTASLSVSTIVVILFIFLAGFLINQAIQRNRSLSLSISVELSRIRRIVHLTEAIEGREKWKEEMRKVVVSYLEIVGTKDFRDYGEAHHDFRKITHEIYLFKPKTKKDELIFSELLEVTRDLAYQRQQVEASIRSPISVYTKSSVAFVAFIAVILLLGAREERETVFFIAGTTTSILLVLDIFFSLDILTREDRRGLSRMYADSAFDMKSE